MYLDMARSSERHMAVMNAVLLVLHPGGCLFVLGGAGVGGGQPSWERVQRELLIKIDDTVKRLYAVDPEKLSTGLADRVAQLLITALGLVLARLSLCDCHSDYPMLGRG